MLAEIMIRDKRGFSKKIIERSKIINCLLFFLLLGVTVLFYDVAYAQIAVTPSQTAAVLAQRLAGQGITISNATLTCPTIANGIFTVTTSNLGLDSGIILTSGRAATSGNSYGCNGPQLTATNANASTNNNAAGDILLNPLANTTTHDACRLAFDIVPKGDSISFRYVFGSEEYWKSACSGYNDAFGFFISGPNIAGTQNMALVPGTNIPVAVNSVNSGIAGSQGNINNCYAMGPGSPFPAYYIDNSMGGTVTYFGFTTVLTAAHAVTPCSTYHLILTIADGGNNLYDSGVFIEAGSLKTGGFHVFANAVNAVDTFIVKGCDPGHFVFTRSQKKATAQTLKFFISGSAINGTDYAAIADSVIIPANDSVADLTINGLPTIANGTKILKLLLISPYSCNGPDVIDSAYIKILDAPAINIITPDTSICAGGSLQLSVQGTDSLNYNWTPPTGLNSSTIKEPIASPTVRTTYTITGTWSSVGCPPVSDQLTIDITPLPTVSAGPDTTACSGSSLQLYTNVNPPAANYIYQWQGPGSFSATAANPLLQNITPADTGVYTVAVNVAGCPPVTATALINIVPPINVDAGADISICAGTVAELNATASPSLPTYLYHWTGPNGFSADSAHVIIQNATAIDTGIYTISVSGNGCPPATDELYIGLMSPLSISAGNDTSLCTGGSVSFDPVVTPQAPNYNYQWAGPADFSSNSAAPTIYDVNELNTGTYVLSVTYPGCLPVFDSLNVIVHPIPPAPDVTDISPLTYCQNEDAADLFISEAFPLWYTEAIGTQGTIRPPVPNTTEKGRYSYYVSQVVDRCESPKSIIEVVVQKCCDDNLFIPTVFSPNNDGRNDRFHLPEGVNHRIQYMYIYNRFGQLVFSSDYDHQSWDGTFKGQAADVGVYYYYLSVECKDGAIIKRSGNVTLVR